jgi:hypothetical protein
VLEMHLRYYFPRELSALLADAGFEPPRIFGGYAGEPFDPCTNELLVYEARKPGPR